MPPGGRAIELDDRTGLRLSASSKVRVENVQVTDPVNGKSGVFVLVRPR